MIAKSETHLNLQCGNSGWTGYLCNGILASSENEWMTGIRTWMILRNLVDLRSNSENIYCKLQYHFYKIQNWPQLNNMLFRDPYTW